MEHNDQVSVQNLSTRGPRHPWLLALLGLAGLSALGLALSRRLADHRAVAAQAVPVSQARKVLVARVSRGSTSSEMALPGTVQAAERAVLNGMAAGVVREVRVNIGDTVKKGQLLAVVDAPEVTAQYVSARTRVWESEKNIDLVRQKAARIENLSKSNITSQQEADAARAEYNSALAAVDRNKADAQRFAALVGYQRLVAPFDGTVTRRYVDPGAVVGNGSTPIVELSTTQKLEIVVDIPQSATEGMRPGVKLKVTARGKREPVEVTVLRTAGALDPTTRSLRTELAVPENSGLLAGAYVNVTVKQVAVQALLIPAAALSVGTAGQQIYVVSAERRIQRRSVRVLRDLGREIELDGEVREGETLVLFPPVDLNNDDLVEPTEPPKPKPAASASAAPAGSAPPAASPR